MNTCFQILEGGFDRNFTYIIGCPVKKEIALIDCAYPWDQLEQELGKWDSQGFNLTKVFLTHSHGDHVLSLKELVEMTKARVYAHPAEEERIFKLTRLRIDQYICDKSILKIGEEKVEAHFTPGHQSGCTSFIWRDKIFTGDTLFIGKCGRCDFPESDPEAQLNSLRFLANQIDENLIVHSGHNYGAEPYTSLKVQKETNPFMEDLSDDRYSEEIRIRWYQRRMGKIPSSSIHQTPS
ncbi:MAG: MBL fold metallo-hydrolase [Candidatus Caenarcaniphilales bacterium]|nr:MBL fold metallo-hydrolase [Candidatus Caenarcaniphilales bacterium]